MRICSLVAMIAAVLSAPSPVEAQVTVFTDKATFQASLPSPTTIDFDALSNSTTLAGDEFQSDGVIITHLQNKQLNVLSSPPVGSGFEALFGSLPNGLSSSYASVGHPGYNPACCGVHFNNTNSDDIRFSFDAGASAAGIHVGENDFRGITVRFLDMDGNPIHTAFLPPFGPHSGFFGITSVTPIGAVEVLNAALDGDGVFYDDLVFQELRVAPVADAGADRFVEATSAGGALVSLDGSSSSDIDGDILTFEWRDSASQLVGTTAIVNLSLALGVHTFTLSVDDGNGGLASDTVQVTVQDTLAPAITLASPTEVSYTLGQPVAAAYACTDDGSGVVGCTGSVVGGATIDTGTVGSKDFTVNATDAVGNTASSSVSYVVTYGQCSLFDQTAAHKAGGTVPIKLQLCNAAGANVSDASVPVVAVAVYLVSTSATGTLADSGNANPDNQFRFAGGSYIFNLSLKGFAQGTYELAYKAGNDPTTHTVQFQVK